MRSMVVAPLLTPDPPPLLLGTVMSFIAMAIFATQILWRDRYPPFDSYESEKNLLMTIRALATSVVLSLAGSISLLILYKS